jgi:hypothetical protein
VRQGASWTAYHLQLTVAAVARPIRGSMGTLGVLAAEPSWLLLAQTKVCPEERPAGIERSGVVAVVDTASRQATASVAGVQHAVSTHPVSASRIRLSSRPLSGHLGCRPESPALGRLLSTRPLSTRPVSTRPLSSRPVSAPSGRVRLLPPQTVAVGPGRGGRATVITGTGGGPWGCRAVDGSINGRGGRDAGDAAKVAVAGGRSVADPGRRGGCGPWRPRLPAERPGRPGRGAERPSRAAALWAREQAAARGGRMPRGCRPRAGCATTVGGRRRA